MGRYIHWGLEKAGHEVWSVGPYSRGTIPWGDFKYPQRYWMPPNIETPDQDRIPVADVLQVCKKVGFKPNLLVQAADVYHLSGKSPIPNIVIGTDPHCIDYTEASYHADDYFSMQKFYSNGAKWMPYGFDQDIHQYFPDLDQEYDVALCGLQYDHRKNVLKRVSDAGHKVYCGLGLIYDEYVKMYNQSKIAFNWSSKEDLPARFWEGLAMARLVVTNRVPDLQWFDFKDKEDYVGFDTEDEAVELINYYLNHESEARRIALNGYKKVQLHTYQHRVSEMLRETTCLK